MTVSEKLQAVLAPFAGKTLSTKQIQALVLEQFPETNIGSILPSDYAGANRNGVQYGDKLLSRAGSGYTVLAPEQCERKPRSGRSRESLDSALASAKALITPKE